MRTRNPVRGLLNGYTADTLAAIAELFTTGPTGWATASAWMYAIAIAAYLGSSKPTTYQIKWIYAARDGANPQPVDINMAYNEQAFVPKLCNVPHNMTPEPTIAPPDMSGRYLSKIAPEHALKPNYIGMVSACIQPFVDAQALINHLPLDFDIDYAVGVQFDAVGVRVGPVRVFEFPLPDVRFRSDDSPSRFDCATGRTAGHRLSRHHGPRWRYLPSRVVCQIVGRTSGRAADGIVSALDKFFSSTACLVFAQDTPYMQTYIAVSQAIPSPLELSILDRRLTPLSATGIKRSTPSRQSTGRPCSVWRPERIYTRLRPGARAQSRGTLSSTSWADEHHHCHLVEQQRTTIPPDTFVDLITQVTPVADL